MFCTKHSIPHENCPSCLPTVVAMRPTVFAELAAAELHAGTHVCPRCDYLLYQAVASCPRCVAPYRLQGRPEHDDAPTAARADPWDGSLRDLTNPLLRELVLAALGNAAPTAHAPRAGRRA
jgi:hypothetical protein